jgi:hypothetical protein
MRPLARNAFSKIRCPLGAVKMAPPLTTSSFDRTKTSCSGNFPGF